MGDVSRLRAVRLNAGTYEVARRAAVLGLQHGAWMRSRGKYADVAAQVDLLQRQAIASAALEVFERIDVSTPPCDPPRLPRMELDMPLPRRTARGVACACGQPRCGAPGSWIDTMTDKLTHHLAIRRKN